ncbi:MAG TPA: hypothetical protein VFG42_16140 [Baekduia sp.]|uniref:hypothetical protein n=1 Tax=Baekduia sp. TaxID=2600305 RepID=UPI002D790985|nr:hypothetical protein [Baekduia sp.]HET6508324.1 hypothetical protein [Baekduia sp.]
MPPEPTEPTRLDDLRARLRDTREAAQRLAEEIPDAPAEAQHAAADEISALVGVLRALRDAVPDDLWEQVREIVRQLLVLLRALLDLVVERLGGERDAPRGGTATARGRGPDLQDIPIT